MLLVIQLQLLQYLRVFYSLFIVAKSHNKTIILWPEYAPQLAVNRSLDPSKFQALSSSGKGNLDREFASDKYV